MFITTDTGRLQNLTLLQDVITVDNEDGTYSVGYYEISGIIVKELSFDTKAAADAKVAEIRASLV